jgi:hypothetical protein
VDKILLYCVVSRGEFAPENVPYSYCISSTIEAAPGEPETGPSAPSIRSSERSRRCPGPVDAARDEDVHTTAGI